MQAGESLISQEIYADLLATNATARTNHEPGFL